MTGGRMTKSVLLILLLLAPALASAAVLEALIPGTEGSHAFDLGTPIETVISLSLSMQGEALSWYYECHNVYPGGEVDYDHWEPIHFYAELSDGNAGHTYTETFLGVSGGPMQFDVTLGWSTWGWDPETFLSDGTGTLTIDMWVELFPPESEDCGLAQMGYVNFSGPLVLTVECEGPVATTTETWGAIKNCYR
jgi:hypothetical protein